MATGLVIGKFYPPHQGHKSVIDTAINTVNRVYVIVCERDGDKPSGSLRAKWIEEWYKDNKNVHVILIKNVYDDNDTELWASLCKTWLGFTPDYVFTSEFYGEPFAKCLGCKHVSVDLYRRKIPISGTMIRNNPSKYLDYLEPNVKAFYVPRIVLVGAESTGKTTLAKRLTEHYKGRTIWVPEYARILCEEKLKDNFNSNSVPTFHWTTEEFIEIANGQKRTELEAAMKDGVEIVICDTDVFAASIWHERYLGFVSDKIEEMAKDYENEVHRQIYLLTDNNVPFVQDGYRDGENIRDWMFSRFLEKLTSENKKFDLLIGSYDDRFNQALKAIDSVLKN